MSGFFKNTGQDKWSRWELCKVVLKILNDKPLLVLIGMEYMNIISMFKKQLFIVVDNHV